MYHKRPAAYYVAEGRSICWGDFGDILVAGFDDGSGGTERIDLMRTGPFVPPVTFPSACVITESCRRLLDESDLQGVAYREVKKLKIVSIDWHLWDRGADLCDWQLPASEPEDYIYLREHDEALSQGIGPLWQLCPPERYVEYIFLSDRRRAINWDRSDCGDCDIFKKKGLSRELLLTPKARDWFASVAGEWISFREIETS